MKKPKLFLMSLAAFGLGALLVGVGILLTLISNMNSVAIVLSALGAVLVIVGLTVFVLRQEKQNQRTNSTATRHHHLLKSALNELDDLRDVHVDLTGQVAQTVQQAVQSAKIAPALVSSQALAETPTAQVRVPKIVQSPKQQVSVLTLPNGASREQFTLLLNRGMANTDTLPLVKAPFEISLPVDGANLVELVATIANGSGKDDAKAGLVSVKALDVRGNEIQHQLLSSRSEQIGYFAYLPAIGALKESKVQISVPQGTSKLKIAFRRWSGSANILNELRFSIDYIPTSALQRRSSKQVKVASILDEFSHNCFRYECDLVALTPQTWRAQMDAFQPDMFLCESAWSGADSDVRPWMGRVYSSENFNYENRQALLDILDYCKQRNIPTVFWNKEDPSHYEDKKHNFVSSAIQFDHIFTTDLPSVDRYKEEYGHKSVHVLPFAVQPRLFNPIRNNARSNDVIFAGGWYSNHVARCEDMTTMFNAVQNSDFGLKVYDRFYNSDDESHDFPEQFRFALNPPVPNSEVSKVYKESHIGMTINTETKSPTMFARRIFELMACNTFVVSNYSVGVEKFFGDDVLYLDRDPESLAHLNSDSIEASKKRNLDKVLSEHTYLHRFHKILDVAGIKYSKADTHPAVLVYLNDLDFGETVWNKLRGLRDWSGPKTIILGANIPAIAFGEALTAWNRDGVRVVSEKLILSGETQVDDAFGSAVAGFLIPEDVFGAGNWSVEEVRNLAMHQQYVDVPVCAVGRAGLNESDAQFSFHKISGDIPVVVAKDGFVDLIRTRNSYESFAAYAV